MWEAALKRRSKLTRLAPAAVAGSLTTTFTLVTPHEDSEPNVERVAELSKTPYQMAARPLPSCPPIFAKCARIASENFRWQQNLPSIAQCIGRAEQSCSRNDQICAVHDECVPTLPSIPACRLLPANYESRKLTCSSCDRSSIPCLQKCRTGKSVWGKFLCNALRQQTDGHPSPAATSGGVSEA